MKDIGHKKDSSPLQDNVPANDKSPQKSSQDLDLAFDPIEIAGEPLSQTIINGRR